MQWGATEEELKQLKEQEKLVKDAEEKFKSVDSETNRTLPLRGRLTLGTSDLSRFWEVFKEEFRNRKK